MINKKYTTVVARGFTLIETLAAILVLTIALAGPMTIAQKGLSTALISKDQNTAFNIAQDAIEYVRFARDTNCLASGSSPCPAAQWLNGNATGQTINLGPCVSVSGNSACYFDTFGQSPAAPTGCANLTCSATTTPVSPALYYDPTNNLYTYTSGGSNTVTPFTRTVQIKYNNLCGAACNPDEADITVTVSWSDPQPHSIQVKESLYNWQ